MPGIPVVAVANPIGTLPVSSAVSAICIAISALSEKNQSRPCMLLYCLKGTCNFGTVRFRNTSLLDTAVGARCTRLHWG